MARFYFDLHECGHEVVLDEEGSEIPNLEGAGEHAILAARDIMKDEVDKGRLCLGCAIVVRDETGAKVLVVPFAEALTVTFGADR